MKRENLKLFIQKFKPFYEEVKNDADCRKFVTKKYRHSIQVLQIGEEIAKRDDLLKNESPEFLALGEKALLFHDVGRFAEAGKMYEGHLVNNHDSWFFKKYDHGVMSYEMMKNEPGFDDVRILAALKHHGHMMEKFYEDEEFSSVKNAEIKREMTAILKWVRDADKLANFYIQKYEDNLKKDPFFVTMSEEVKNAPLSEGALAQFDAGKVILTSTITSYCDRLLCCLSWIFDLNYKASYMICAEQGYFEMLLAVLAEYNHNEELQKHVANRIHHELSIRAA